MFVFILYDMRLRSFAFMRPPARGSLIGGGIGSGMHATLCWHSRRQVAGMRQAANGMIHGEFLVESRVGRIGSDRSTG